MQNANVLILALNGHLDESFKGALKPRGHHDAIDMPDGAKFVPKSGIAHLFKFNSFILDDFFQASDVSLDSRFEFIR